MNPTNQAINLLHITDSHLFADPEQRLLGLNTSKCLQAVIEHVAASRRTAQRILATGDIAQDASALAYDRFLHIAGQLDLPLHALAGNHDLPEQLQASLGAAATKPVVDHGNWRIIMLNTHVPGSNAGHLTIEQLDLLHQAAQVGPEQNVLVAMHHNPLPMSSQWLDTMQLDNAADFFEQVALLPAIRAVVWGHVHQGFDGTYQVPFAPERAALRMMSTPSTCVQFLPHSQKFGVDNALPGYRWIELYPDGSIGSQIVRLDALPAAAGRLDLSSRGY